VIDAPAGRYRRSDADVGALIAYLRSLPAAAVPSRAAGNR